MVRGVSVMGGMCVVRRGVVRSVSVLKSPFKYYTFTGISWSFTFHPPARFVVSCQFLLDVVQMFCGSIFCVTFLI